MLPISRSLVVAATAAAALACTLSSIQAQSTIAWTVKNIVDAKTDISTKGKLCIAANLGPEVCEKVVNGVHFQADRSHWTRKILQSGGTVVRGVMYFPDFTSGGFTLKMPYNRTAPASNTNGGARHPTDPDYDFIIRDVRHSPGNTTPPPLNTVTCSVEGLTPGNTYEIQIWYGANKATTRTTEWDNGIGGRQGQGGVFLKGTGQVATGTFKATASGKQTFTNYQHAGNPNATPPLPETHNAISAIQIRDLTPKVLAPRATYYGEGFPGTNTQPNLGGTKCSPAINLSGHPKIGAKLELTAENSSGAASSAMLVVGLTPIDIHFLSGRLLVPPTLVVGVPMPAPATPYVHAHELKIPLTIPNAPVPVYTQVLQLDKGAVEGVSLTPGLKIEIGL